MRAHLLAELLFQYPTTEVKVPVGFNQFDVEGIDIEGETVIIIIPEEANNPPPEFPDDNIRRLA